MCPVVLVGSDLRGLTMFLQVVPDLGLTARYFLKSLTRLPWRVAHVQNGSTSLSPDASTRTGPLPLRGMQPVHQHTGHVFLLHGLFIGSSSSRLHGVCLSVQTGAWRTSECVCVVLANIFMQLWVPPSGATPSAPSSPRGRSKSKEVLLCTLVNFVDTGSIALFASVSEASSASAPSSHAPTCDGQRSSPQW